MVGSAEYLFDCLISIIDKIYEERLVCAFGFCTPRGKPLESPVD